MWAKLTKQGIFYKHPTVPLEIKKAVVNKSCNPGPGPGQKHRARNQ
jgi:hypothetical protein